VLRPDDAETTPASWNAELPFRRVPEATADKAGLESIEHPVKDLAESLGVAYAFVAEFAGAALGLRRPHGAGSRP
jgi:hypothetical protein